MGHPPRLVFAIPGDIETRSGGYGYDRRVIAELTALGWTVEHLVLPAGFPAPDRADLVVTAGLFAAIADASLVLVDGLAFGAMAEIAMAEKDRLRLVALVHHPLALETGLTPEQVLRLKVSETAALRATRGVVVTSPTTARTLVADYDVAAALIHVAVPGTEAALVARGGSSDLPMILSVGSLTRRKDHALLISALQGLADRRWQCRIVGSDRMDPATSAALRRQVTESGLGDRVALVGAVDDVAVEYDRADIFALASRYEGYGMVFAEAMARGLPIVACRGGAVPDLVPATAGILVEPGDIENFAAALAALLDDRQLRCRYADGSLAAGRQLLDWKTTVEGLSTYLETIA